MLKTIFTHCVAVILGVFLGFGIIVSGAHLSEVPGCGAPY